MEGETIELDDRVVAKRKGYERARFAEVNGSSDAADTGSVGSKENENFSILGRYVKS